MTGGTSAADIAGATFGGIAASAVLLKAAHSIYIWWESRPTRLIRLLNRIATKSASKEEEDEAKLELRRLDMETRHQMLNGVMARYTESGDVEAFLELNKFRMVVDGMVVDGRGGEGRRVEGRVGQGRRVDEVGRTDTTASQMGHTSSQNANNHRSNDHRNKGDVLIEEPITREELRPRRRG